jgi:hypothetical protein
VKEIGTLTKAERDAVLAGAAAMGPPRSARAGE